MQKRRVPNNILFAMYRAGPPGSFVTVGDVTVTFGNPTTLDVTGTVNGEIVTDLRSGTIYQWDAASQTWQAVGTANIVVSPRPPVNPSEGDIYLDPITATFYVYQNGQWVVLFTPMIPGGNYSIPVSSPLVAASC